MERERERNRNSLPGLQRRTYRLILANASIRKNKRAGLFDADYQFPGDGPRKMTKSRASKAMRWGRPLGVRRFGNSQLVTHFLLFGAGKQMGREAARRSREKGFNATWNMQRVSAASRAGNLVRMQNIDVSSASVVQMVIP